MNAAVKRLVSALILIGIITLAICLRFYGIDWSYKDGMYTAHPDERHYQNCVDVMNFQWFSEDEMNQLIKEWSSGKDGETTWLGWLSIEHWTRPAGEMWQLFYQRNLHIPNPQNSQRGDTGLRPWNYNYGTLPLHMYMMYRHYIVTNVIPPGDGNDGWHWVLFSFIDAFTLSMIGFVLILAFRFYLSVLKSFNEAEPGCPKLWKNERKLILFMPCMLIPFTGLALFWYLPTEVADLSRYNPSQISIVLIGRIVTAFCGVLTVLLAYLIGKNAYNRSTGLIAAMMLATCMVHIQTSHFATTDGLAAFWTTAAIYAFLKVSQKPRLLWYVLGAIFTGFAIGTKWSAVILPAMLWFAHAIATWSDERQGKDGRLIHSVWLVVSGLVLLQFFIAARSIDPLFHVTLGEFRDFYLLGIRKYFLIAGVGFTVLSTLIYLLIRKIRNEEDDYFSACFQIYLPWVWLCVAFAVGWCAFLFAQPMAYFDAYAYARDLTEMSNINASGINDAVYTRQFHHTLPVITLLDNLFYPSLDYVTAFFVITGCIFAGFRLFTVKCKSDLFLVVWAIPAFVVYSSLDSKFPRYIVPVLPVMIVLGARFMVELCRINVKEQIAALPWLGLNARKTLKGIGWAGGVTALIFGWIYGSAYTSMYSKVHPLKQAENYVRAAMKPGQTMTQNNWDEGIGIHVEGKDQLDLHQTYDRNPSQRIQHFTERLQENDFIVLPSKRGYGTTLQNPDEYPVTNRFVRALFAEQLGFRIAKVIENPVEFMGIRFYVDQEDETARIYDHPKVIIFEKYTDLTAAQINALITNPPNWINEITKEEILSLRDGKPVFARSTNAPVWRWYVLLFGLGALMFLILFPLMKVLPDGGYAVSKTVGLAFFSWLVWYLASNKIFLLSQFSMAFVLLLMIAAAVFAWQHWGKEWLRFLQSKWKFIVTIEILFIVVWAIMLSVRMYHPSISWGEKPMNASFINATYRTAEFPPEDPWISGHSINYYYYGQAVFSIAGKFMGIAPEYLFNVAGTSVAALVAVTIFTIAFAVCRCIWMSLIATYLAVFAGTIITFIQVFSHALNPTKPYTEVLAWKDWYPEWSLWEILTGWKYCIYWMWSSGLSFIYTSETETAATMWESFRVWCGWVNYAATDGLALVAAAIWKVLVLMWYCLVSYTGLASAEMQATMDQDLRLLNYETLMWKARDTFAGTAASEFPPWTHLFMDFHAHMLVIPFTWGFLGVLMALFLSPKKELDTPRMVGFSSILALLLGTVICTNTWDMPALAIALITALLVKWFRESENVWQTFKQANWLNVDTLQSWMRFPFGIIVLVFLLQLIMYFPFHANFVARVSGLGIMTEGHAPLTTFMGTWGPFLFPLVVATVLAAIVRHDNQLSLLRTAGFALLFVCVLASSLWLTNQIREAHYLPSTVTAEMSTEERAEIMETAKSQAALWMPILGEVPVPKPHNPNLPPFDLTVFGLFFPFLVVLFLQLWNRKLTDTQVFGFLIGFIGLGLVLGIEWFHIKEGIWGRPNHRWNTLFKFNIQVWHYFSIFAVFGFIYAFYCLRDLRNSIGWFLSMGSRLAFGFVFVLLLALTVPFTVIAPYVVTQTGGGISRDVRDADVPTLDGLSWLHNQHYDTYAGIQWFNRFVEGTPNIVEYIHRDSQYIDYAWFSTYTGLPAVLGWGHHVAERLKHEERNERERDIAQIYQSNNKEEVIELLGKYDTEYLVFGYTEMHRPRTLNNRTPLGIESLQRFQEWGDVFRLVYRLGEQSVFRVDRSQNRIYGISGNDSFMPIPAVTGDLPNATSLHPSAVGSNMYDGSEGDGNGQFLEPRGLAQDAAGFFYIADTFNHRIQAFHEDGRFEGKTGAEGNNPGEFKEPNDVTVDINTGDIYVADTWNHRVIRMDNKGNVLGNFSGTFFGPRGIVYHPQVNAIFVCDTGGHMIRVLNQQGQVIENIGITGGGRDELAFREPVGIDVIHETGDIVIVDSLNKRLKIYDISGQLKTMIPIQTSWNGEGGFEGHVTTSVDGIIYMTDPIERSIHAYAQDGRLLGRVITDNDGNEFLKPVGIHMSLDGNLVVSDNGAHRIKKVKAFATLPQVEPTATESPTAIPTPLPVPTPTNIPEPEMEVLPSATPTVSGEPEDVNIQEIKRFDRWFEPFSNPPREQTEQSARGDDSSESASDEVVRPEGMKTFERWFMPFSAPRE